MSAVVWRHVHLKGKVQKKIKISAPSEMNLGDAAVKPLEYEMEY